MGMEKDWYCYSCKCLVCLPKKIKSMWVLRMMIPSFSPSDCSGCARSTYEVTIDFVNRCWCPTADAWHTASYRLIGAGPGISYCVCFTENMESTLCTVCRSISEIVMDARLFETWMSTRLLKKNGLGMERDSDCYPCKCLVHLLTRINSMWVLRVRVERCEARAPTLPRVISMPDLRNSNFPLRQREECFRH